MSFAIFPGTFNPVHLGHLMIAESAAKQFLLDQVLFVVSPHPPNKLNSQDFLPFEKRIELLNIAISTNDKFRVDTREANRQGPSYTIDTVNEILNEQSADSTKKKINFILGVDSFLSLPSWRNAEELGEKCRFLIACRPGWQSIDVEDSLSSFHDKLNWEIIDSPPLSISSTQIRTRKRDKKSFRYLLVPEVFETYRSV